MSEKIKEESDPGDCKLDTKCSSEKTLNPSESSSKLADWNKRRFGSLSLSNSFAGTTSKGDLRGYGSSTASLRSSRSKKFPSKKNIIEEHVELLAKMEEAVNTGQQLQADIDIQNGCLEELTERNRTLQARVEFLKEKQKEELEHAVTLEEDLEREKLELATIVADEEKNLCTEQNSAFCRAIITDLPKVKIDLESAAIYSSYPNYNFKSEMEHVASELRRTHTNLQKINDELFHFMERCLPRQIFERLRNRNVDGEEDLDELLCAAVKKILQETEELKEAVQSEKGPEEEKKMPLFSRFSRVSQSFSKSRRKDIRSVVVSLWNKSAGKIVGTVATK